jgi:hypothetical protein
MSVCVDVVFDHIFPDDRKKKCIAQKDSGAFIGNSAQYVDISNI